MPVSELEATYKDRPDGSESTLSTYADGFRILWMITLLFKELRPLAFFGFHMFYWMTYINVDTIGGLFSKM